MADTIRGNEVKTDRIAARRRWVRPTVRRLAAGDAEVGPRPDNSDGAFSFS